jgi:hypothetical protein
MLPPFIPGSLDLATKILSFVTALVGFLGILKKSELIRKLSPFKNNRAAVDYSYFPKI